MQHAPDIDVVRAFDVEDEVAVPSQRPGTPASTCLRNPMICSSLYLLVLMSAILQVDGLRYLYGGMAGREQVKTTIPFR